MTGCMLFQAHKDRWVPEVSSVEERTFLAMIKWAAVRANELPKIRNVQVYAPNDLLNPRFCGFMISLGQEGDLFTQVHTQLSAYGWCFFPFFTVSFRSNLRWLLSNHLIDITSVKSPVPLSYQTQSSLSRSYFTFRKHLAQWQLLLYGNRSFSWLPWPHPHPVVFFLPHWLSFQSLLALPLLLNF